MNVKVLWSAQTLRVSFAIHTMTKLKKNALHVFRDVRSKKNYCSVCLWGENKVPKMCDGEPVIRERRGEALYGSKYFLGYTGYHRAPQARHTIRKLDSFDDEGLNFLRALLAGKITPQDVDRDRSCTYVHGKKKRGTTLCQVHKEPLVNIPCEIHRMNVFEPVSQDGVDIPKMVYVSCFGIHTHPPPPPPNHTLRKMKILEAEVEKDPLATNAVLRKRVEEKVMSQAVRGKPSGSAHVPVGSSGRQIRTLREKKRKIISDAEGLMALAVEQTFQYCRDIKIVGPNIVVTCAHDDMLMHAALCNKFAGDATFKTVRRPCKGQWYLYNIIAPARRDGGNSKTVVVFRALMTGLSANDYRVVWRCFFREIITSADMIRGESVPGSSVLRVPYQELPPALMNRSSFLSSITMDFETAEALGCAQALRDVCGGGVESHINGLLIGCRVHLDRYLRRRSQCPKIAAKTTRSSEERLKLYREFVCAESRKTAMDLLAEIHKFDPQWVKWVKTSGLLPLICKVFSIMTSAHRADGYVDTNGVESQNRRGNLIAGKHLHPVDAIHELGKKDSLDIAKVDRGIHSELREPRPPKQRNIHTLAPTGSKNGAGTKRRVSSQRGGMGPSQKRTCCSQSAKNTISVSDEGSNKQRSFLNQSSKERGSGTDRECLSYIVHMRVQRMLCQLEMKTISDSSLDDAVKDRRSEAITNLLMKLTAVDKSDIEGVKSLVLETRLRAVQNKERSFARQLFKVYSEGCLSEDPLSSDT